MDDADRAQQDAEVIEQAASKRRQEPYMLDPGYSGGCEYCGEFSKRLINGFCAPCRDRYRL